MPLGPLQMTPELGPPQAPSAEAPAQPHRPVSGRHWGLAPPQRAALVGEHSVQAPASGPLSWQAGRAGSGQLGAPSALHGTQRWADGSQCGAIPPQSASSRQPTHTPTPDEASQRGAEPGQWVVSVGVQAAQAPLGWQRGAAEPQSVSAAQARQVPVVASQVGRVPEQAPALPGAHCAQVPEAVHTGVDDAHSASAAQGRQVWLAPSQVGAEGPQSAPVTQATHCPVETSHAGVAPVQRALLVAEHAPHDPLAWQAGVAPPHSASPVQARQL